MHSWDWLVLSCPSFTQKQDALNTQKQQPVYDTVYPIARTYGSRKPIFASQLHAFGLWWFRTLSSQIENPFTREHDINYHWKLRQQFDHLGLLAPLNQETKERVSVSLVIDSDYEGELGLLLHKEVWHRGFTGVYSIFDW